MHKRPSSAFPALLLALSGALGCARGTVDTESRQDEGPFLEPARRVLAEDELGDSLVEREADESALWQRDDPFPLQGEPPAPLIVDEGMACDMIVDTYHAHGLDLGCATTTHVCPDLLRFAFGAACLQYRAATVRECRDRILDATSCEELWATSCAVEPLWGSAPLGCPASPE